MIVACTTDCSGSSFIGACDICAENKIRGWKMKRCHAPKKREEERRKYLLSKQSQKMMIYIWCFISWCCFCLSAFLSQCDASLYLCWKLYYFYYVPLLHWCIVDSWFQVDQRINVHNMYLSPFQSTISITLLLRPHWQEIRPRHVCCCLLSFDSIRSMLRSFSIDNLSLVPIRSHCTLFHLLLFHTRLCCLCMGLTGNISWFIYIFELCRSLEVRRKCRRYTDWYWW